MIKDEALKLALEALEYYSKGTTTKHRRVGAFRICCGTSELTQPHSSDCKAVKAITAIREALADHIGDANKMVEQPEQETVAYQDIAEKCRLETVPAKGTLLHTSPPASKSWQGLTGDGIDKLADMHRKE